ncbi:MAG: M56 family metallopeptidase [Acidimicrobiales bacterium]
MTWRLIAPTVLTALIAYAGFPFRNRLHPKTATRVFTALAVAAALALMTSLALVAWGFVLHLPGLAGRFGWCRSIFHVDDTVPAFVGVLALLGLLAATGSGLRQLVRQGHFRRAIAHPTEVVIVDDRSLVAVAVAGGLGHIVMSTAMLELLDDDETAVVLSHERAHLRCRHDRYRFATSIAVGAFPVFWPLRRLVGYTTERWADEEAAHEVGNRALVASTLTKIALAIHGTCNEAMAISGFGVADRVQALGEPPVGGGSWRQRWHVVSAVLVVGTVTASVIQLQQLIAFAAHACGT